MTEPGTAPGDTTASVGPKHHADAPPSESMRGLPVERAVEWIRAWAELDWPITWAFAHGHGLVSFLRDPNTAFVEYLKNAAPTQLLLGTLDFALTFIPGSTLALGTRRAVTTTATRQTTKTAAAEDASRIASEEAYRRASELKNTLPAPKRNRQKVVSSNGSPTLSGWAAKRPQGFQTPNIDEVLRTTDEMNYPRTPNFRDQGETGRYYASRAERQKPLRQTSHGSGCRKQCATIVRAGSELSRATKDAAGISQTPTEPGYSGQTAR